MLDERNVLQDELFGFRVGYSTVHQILRVMGDVTDALVPGTSIQDAGSELT